ncbi:MAG TPA: helix-turn-helix domain-containing protein [Gemmataceae bacterium]|nr:helix-turn-helix domain-containing protein [Gemmataceae bacterium]
MSPRKGKKGTGRQAIPSALSPGAESEVMTLQEVADYLHCHYSTAHRLARRGDMPSFLLGGSWRVLKSEIDKWIVSGGGKPSGSVPAKTDGRERSQRKPKPRS